MKTKKLNPTSSSDKKICTTCPYCGVGCGVVARVDEAGTVTVEGDPDHPANFGKLCSKGSALAQTLGNERRITQPFYQNKHLSIAKQQSLGVQAPLYAGTTATQPLTDNASWEIVLDDIASRFNNIIAKHGRDSIMFYVSGQLLTEDYYVANKFIKGFIGNNNIDSNSRLCMSSAVAGHTRAFGADLVPGSYEDFENCDLLVMVGANMAWCYPILFARFLAAKKADPNKKLIVIDPRRTDSCEFADLHLPIAAGTDTHLYSGLLNYLEQQGCRDDAYINQSTGVKKALEAVQAWTIDKVAAACAVPADSIREFYETVATTDKTVTAFSMGVNQSKSGTDKVNAIINTHILTGRVGQVGASPFSLTGQPNAMGGREVGALANLLAAHLRLDNKDHRQLVADFWSAPQAISPHTGVKACDAADAILDGRIKAIWIMATNPVVSLPEADKFRQALNKCDLVIVSDCSLDSDTVHCADIVLPAQGWGEKSGTVTNAERRISRQRSLLPALGASKPDWWILSQVAKRMGMAGFDYQHPYEIFNEHLALTAYRNQDRESASRDTQRRHLNLARAVSGMNVETTATAASMHGEQNHPSYALSPETYDAMLPVQWGGARIPMFEVADSSTQTTLIAITPIENPSLPNFHNRHHIAHARHQDKEPVTTRVSILYSQQLHLRLITGRLRDQWHTMTRTGMAAQLNQHQSVPALTIHPVDAKQLGITTNDFVQLSPRYDLCSTAQNKTHHIDESLDYPHVNATANNCVMAQVIISDEVRVGDGFMPIHWSNAFASFARVGSIIPTVLDPHSSQPELKNTAISVMPVPMHAFGRILVHPTFKDAIIVQLRAMLADYNDQSEVRSKQQALYVSDKGSSQMPALTWSLSHQVNSIVINVASPVAGVADKWSQPDFWQKFIDKLTNSTAIANLTSKSAATRQPQALPFALGLTNTAFTLDEQQGQLRLIVTQSHNINTAVRADTSNDEGVEERLILAIYIASSLQQLPSAHWLDGCFADTSQIPDDQRYKWLLAGRPASGYIDPGPLVCSCLSVGENIIIEAIKTGCTDAIAVGKRCQAGTNCGSCVGQINTLIDHYAPLEPA